MVKNRALTTIQGTGLVQVGESTGAMARLAQLAREILGENFNPTMPAIEGDDAAILDWLRFGAKAESVKIQREYLRDVCGSATGFLTFVGAQPLATTRIASWDARVKGIDA